MLRQKCPYRKKYGNSRKVVKQRKNRTKVYHLTKTSKSLVSCRICWHMMISVNTFMSYSKGFFAFLKVCKLHSMCAEFQVNK